MQSDHLPCRCVVRTSYVRSARRAHRCSNLGERILDDDMNDVVPGEIGEMIYPDPLDDEVLEQADEDHGGFRGGWFHLGDPVRQDEDGHMCVVDRKKGHDHFGW